MYNDAMQLFRDIFRKAKTPKRQNAQTKPTRCANKANALRKRTQRQKPK
jgi:hypothetical protein